MASVPGCKADEISRHRPLARNSCGNAGSGCGHSVLAASDIRRLLCGAVWHHVSRALSEVRGSGLPEWQPAPEPESRCAGWTGSGVLASISRRARSGMLEVCSEVGPRSRYCATRPASPRGFPPCCHRTRFWDTATRPSSQNWARMNWGASTCRKADLRGMSTVQR